MSYIENKYRTKIFEIFDELSNLDNDLLEQLNKKHVKFINEIAKLCGDLNRHVNLILRKYYPEIKKMEEKLRIQSALKFYYDLINKLTALIKYLENYREIDEDIYISLVEFVEDKDNLIKGKYKEISSQELANFYDQDVRKKIENVLVTKIMQSRRNFRGYNSIEHEIKKIAKIEGTDLISIYSFSDLLQSFKDPPLLSNSAQSIIRFAVGLADDIIRQDLTEIEEDEYSRHKDEQSQKLKQIADKIIGFLISKNHKSVQLTEKENKEITRYRNKTISPPKKIKLSYTTSIITTAKLIPDKQPEI